ncbi:MAG: hypothetical protein PHT91_02720 [Candidatus Nanoarchaeia archaeon]|nr:hypothetical protein [Candidatus Nanoarchaeia archaeon]
MSFHESLEQAKINEADVSEWREATLHRGGDDSSYKGFILIMKSNHLVFVKGKGIIGSARKVYDVPIIKIKKVSKSLGLWIVEANLAEEKDGFLKKMFKHKLEMFNIKNPDAFVSKLKSLMNKE